MHGSARLTCEFVSNSTSLTINGDIPIDHLRSTIGAYKDIGPYHMINDAGWKNFR